MFIYRSVSTIACCLLLAATLLLPSCGKKGDPTLKSYEKPAPPSHLSAIHRESEIIIFWEFPRDREQAIQGFWLMKSTGGADFKKIVIPDNSVRSFTDSDFEPGTKYRYKIVSLNLKGIASNDSYIIEVHPVTVPPSPDNLRFRIMEDSVLLEWHGAGEGTLFNIYRSSIKGTYGLQPLNDKSITGNIFKDYINLRNPVYYVIRGIRGGHERNEGPPSEEIMIHPADIVPAAPSGLRAVVSGEQVFLVWDEVPGIWVTGYRVYREAGTDGYRLIGETATPAFTDREPPVIKRAYRVTALGPVSEGPPAEIRDVVFVPYR